MMKRYIVTIPIAGALVVEVSAPDEETAIERAWDAYDDDGPDCGEAIWDALPRLTTGNVLHAAHNEVEARECEGGTK